MSTMPPELIERLLIWVHDLAIAAKNVDDLLYYIKKLLNFCVSTNFKLHSIKCQLYKSPITLCGRHMSADDVKFDPRLVSSHETMTMPTITGEMLQLASAMQWLRKNISEFLISIKPLLDAFERSYNVSGKTTKRTFYRTALDTIS